MSPPSLAFHAQRWGLYFVSYCPPAFMKNRMNVLACWCSARSEMQVNMFRDRESYCNTSLSFYAYNSIAHGTGWLLCNLPWPRTIRQWQRSHCSKNEDWSCLNLWFHSTSCLSVKFSMVQSARCYQFIYQFHTFTMYSRQTCAFYPFKQSTHKIRLRK
jgi:hypothetical protein